MRLGDYFLDWSMQFFLKYSIFIIYLLIHLLIVCVLVYFIRVCMDFMSGIENKL